MTADEFREIALSFPETVESSHMNHPDFRAAGGRIFATLNADLTKGMANLSPESQQEFMLLDPSFEPAAGAWGRSGATMITLATANFDVVRSALATAWEFRSLKKK